MARLGGVFPLIRNGASIKQTDGAEGIPITRIETIANREIDRSRMGYADVTDLAKYADYQLQDGDILMSHINSEKHLGKVARYKAIDGEYIIHGMNLLMLRADKSLITPGYAECFFNSDMFLRQIPNITKKSVNQASFNVSALKELQIPIPTLATQHEIEMRFEKVDSLISLRKQQIAKLDELVKAWFVEMFGDPRSNPMNLPMLSLSELGEWNSGGTPARSNADYFTGDIDWYSAGELNTLYLNGSIEKITEEAIQNSAAKLFPAGSMLVGMYDTAAFKMGILRTASASNQACACIEPNDSVNIVWLHYCLQLMRDYFLEQRRGVRQKNLNLGMIRSFQIPYAQKQQQDGFAAFVAQTDQQKLTIQHSLAQLELLKKALMQKYFG